MKKRLIFFAGFGTFGFYKYSSSDNFQGKGRLFGVFPVFVYIYDRYKHGSAYRIRSSS